MVDCKEGHDGSSAASMTAGSPVSALYQLRNALGVLRMDSFRLGDSRTAISGLADNGKKGSLSARVEASVPMRSTAQLRTDDP